MVERGWESVEPVTRVQKAYNLDETLRKETIARWIETIIICETYMDWVIAILDIEWNEIDVQSGTTFDEVVQTYDNRM